MTRVVWITNDLPPRTGGIQQFVMNLLRTRGTAERDTLVLGPAIGRRQADDPVEGGPWRLERLPGAVLPGPLTRRRLARRLRDESVDVVVIASVWPLGLLAPGLRRVTGAHIIGITHGAEAGLAGRMLRPLLRRLLAGLDTVTVISDFTADRIASAVPERTLERLRPGVDVERFGPLAPDDERTRALRARWGIPAAAPLVGCVARLVARKGQDRLLAAWPRIHAAHPDAWLVLVGEGPQRARLARRAARLPQVRVVGRVPWDQLPVAYAALDVFAMPVRTRLGGIDVEGLGISFLEAQASGSPVVIGRSGGATETLLDPGTGQVVDGLDVAAVAQAVTDWLADPVARARARELGPRKAHAWSWDAVGVELERLLSLRQPR